MLFNGGCHNVTCEIDNVGAKISREESDVNKQMIVIIFNGTIHGVVDGIATFI